MRKKGQKIFEVLWKEEELCIASWARWEAQWKGLVDLERRCQDTSREIRLLNKDKKKSKMRTMARLECKTERVKDRKIQFVGEIKYLENTKAEEALQLVRNEHALWFFPNEKEETKRLQSGTNRGRMKRWLGHHQETSQTGLTGRRR